MSDHAIPRPIGERVAGMERFMESELGYASNSEGHVNQKIRDAQKLASKADKQSVSNNGRLIKIETLLKVGFAAVTLLTPVAMKLLDLLLGLLS
ncbi:hypothetical protein [Rubinisphaera italica]|uniref:Uncharacterized protein n=1 Tax=Rubinisphaera italica TaxID=2527969 RepID=A0A5C5XK06_9PLAN|nr:hypothetical protein [Rubinisphaera italica]TWT63184.1 hypothetical protein Pan54_39370 [Rubinisphaera italica]